MQQFYHGTLIRHHDTIAAEGIQPRIGEFTINSYGKDANGLIPAVFMADEDGLERVVHAMVAAAIDEVTEDDLEEWDIGPDEHLNDALFCKYGIIYVIEVSDEYAVTGSPREGIAEPLQAEHGDWYSLAAVQPVRGLTGDELREFLDDRGILPSYINNFVDEDFSKKPPALG